MLWKGFVLLKNYFIINNICMLVFDSIKNIYEYWVAQWIINGCWQKGRISFSQLFLALESVDNFIPEKGKICFKEIEYGCGIHDILCEFWWTRSMKLYSDLWFTFFVNDRISWWKFYYRFPFIFGLFIGLHFKWKDAWNFVK